MAEAVPFKPVKLICGIIASQEDIFREARQKLTADWGSIDEESLIYPFEFTDYYEKQMGKGLKRQFFSFRKLIQPEMLSRIKLRTNRIEEEIMEKAGTSRRAVNIDPGYITTAALIMATAKDFAHRVPLEAGIYAHLEFLFGKKEIRLLDWTYPDFRTDGVQSFFLKVRQKYIHQLRML